MAGILDSVNQRTQLVDERLGDKLVMIADDSTVASN